MKQVLESPSPVRCFSGRSYNKDDCPGFWLAETFSTSMQPLLNVIWRNLTGSKSSAPSIIFFLGGGVKKYGCSGLWFAEKFSTSLQPAKQNLTKLDRKQVLNILYHFVRFINKDDRPSWGIAPAERKIVAKFKNGFLWPNGFLVLYLLKVFPRTFSNVSCPGRSW